ncbi:MAG: metal-sensitive transcriptional regulator [Dehalococcoidia bacterium]
MEPDLTKGTLKRLKYIEGHISGVKKMVENDRYCVDILHQTHAIRRAIEAMESEILRGHFKTHVVDGISEGNYSHIIEELMDLYNMSKKNNILNIDPHVDENSHDH